MMSLYKGIFWIKNIDNYDPIAIKEFGLTKENGIESILLKTDMSDHYLCYLDKEV